MHLTIARFTVFSLGFLPVTALFSGSSAGELQAQSPPVITSLNPGSGAPGATVSLEGVNLGPLPGDNVVYFGAVRATVLSASSSNLAVVVPAGATYAPVTVTVNGLIGYANAAFRPTFSGAGTAINAGSFAPGQNVAASDGPLHVVIADLDGDGKPDLAVANAYSHTISLYRNVSASGSLTAASFAPRVDLPAGSGVDNPLCLIAADLDGDGKLDLVTTERYANVVSIYRNTAVAGSLERGSFSAPVNIGVGGDPRAVQVRDLDRDGRPDLVSANYAGNTISILRNVGTAGSLSADSFAPKVDLPAGNGPYAVVIEDLDGDGKPDLAVVNANAPTVLVYRNLGNPGVIDVNSFTAGVELPAPGGCAYIEAADLDGDGRPDLIACSVPAESVSIYRNLASPGSLAADSFAARIDLSANGWAHDSALGDLNGDGKTDITVATELPSHLSVFENTSPAGGLAGISLASRVDYPSGWNAWGVAVGDLDGDSRPDVVFANAYDDSLTIYRNVAPFEGPPVIEQQPASQTVVIGSNALFKVTAGGSVPLSYQWNFNGAPLDGATNATLVLTNVQMNQAGAYAVTVTNVHGFVISSDAVLTVAFPPATVLVVNAEGVSGGPVTVSIVLVANGNENALSFSLSSFGRDQNLPLLSFSSLTLGSSAAGGMLLVNTNQMNFGRLGVAVALPSDSTFPPGTQEVVRVTFDSAVWAGTQPAVTTISFRDQPLARELSDAQGLPLQASYANGTVTLSGTDLEGDASPRPNGDRRLTISDWVQVGRLVARLDTPTSGAELQRADCAPRQTRGNGALNVTDWVQAGRYFAGLDPMTAVGGPTNEVDPSDAGLWLSGTGTRAKTAGTSSRVVRASSMGAVQGQTITVSVQLESQGDENALGFSVSFDPTACTYAGAALGIDALGAALNLNTSQAQAGKLGVALALPTGASFAAGSRDVLKLSFAMSGSAAGTSAIAFANQPVALAISDPMADELPAGYVSGAIAVNPLPLLTISRAGENLILAWPTWADEYQLQSSPELPGTARMWTNVPGPLQTNLGNILLTLPISSEAMKFYRLRHP